MEERIKLIWDFRGPDSQKIAEHHVVHLKEYAEAEAVARPVFGTESLSEMHHTVFLVVNKAQMPMVRDALRPHRGQLYNDT